MGGCLIGNWFVRPGPKRCSALPKFSRPRASSRLRSSTLSIDHLPFPNRILPSRDGQDSLGQLCDPAVKLDDIGWVGGESGFHRQRSKRRADVIESRALNQSKPRVSSSQPAEQGDKSRTKQQQTCSRAFGKRPARKDVAP